MNGVKVVFTKQMRLAILRFLADGPQYELNSAVLQSALGAIGLRSSRDVVEGECAWLEEAGLVDVERINGTSVVVVRITARGLDVSQGKSTHPGVDKPSPARL